TRYNANGIDLNRNYPDPREGAHPDGNAWQAETVAFMQIAEDNNFVMAANTHGGTEVVNYPWDTWHRLTADDDWWQMVSHEYADTAQFFSPPSYFDGFNDGITNGAAWYVITGGRQDYMNYFQGCREVTLELSHIHTLPESQLDAHWTYNKRSLINYIKQTYYGVRGIITDSITGEPLLAKVEVLSHDMDESHIYSREGQGNYHRLLKTGTYDLKYSKDGYFPKTFYGVVVNDYDSTVLNVELVAAALTADFTADDTSVSLGSDVNFTQQCFGDPDTYEWTFEGGDPATSSEVNPVVTYDEKGSYDVSLTITKGADIQSITKEDYIEVNEEFLMSDSEVTICSGLFMDDGGDGDYSNSKDYTMTFIAEDQSENVVLSAEFLEFDVEFQETCNYDYLKIYDGPNASSTLIGTYCGTDSPGTVFSSNTEKALTFVFHSDNTEVASGWKAMINCSIPQSINELSTNQITIFPNPTEDGFLTIKSTIFMEEVRVVNMNGQVLTSFTSLGKEEYLDLSFLETGIYILTITTDYGVSHQKIQIR
ncbi:MAG: T9SS type A sorting domain-containing protein, partial [Bacteroidales bacterium]|nr:T9SS type A sorting domain-containing protein [Bacteroidales bacterium]